MKNFLQVNRASTGAKKNFRLVNRALKAKKNFNFNFKHLFVLLAVLVTCINTAWGEKVTATYSHTSSAFDPVSFSSNAYFDAMTIATSGTVGGSEATGARCNVAGNATTTVTFTFTAKSRFDITGFSLSSFVNSLDIKSSVITYKKNSNSPTTVSPAITFTKNTETKDDATMASSISMEDDDVFTVTVSITNSTGTNRMWVIHTIDITVSSSCEELAAPTGLECVNQSYNTLSFSWDAVANASSYDVKLWTNSSCTGDPAKSANTTNTTCRIRDLSSSTTYYCKVQTKGDGSTYCTSGGITATAASGTTLSSTRTFKSGETIFFKDAGGTNISGINCLWVVDGGNVYAYFYNATTNNWASGAGAVVRESHHYGNAIYKFTVPQTTSGEDIEWEGVIFTRGTAATWETSKGYYGQQTHNQTPNQNENLFTISTNAPTDGKYNGLWSTYANGAALVGDMNNWRPDKGEFNYSGNIGTMYMDLEANTEYKFKILDGTGWIGCPGTITNTTTPWWTFNTNTDCTLRTGEAGNYAFKWQNTDTKYFGVYYPQARLKQGEYIYFDARDNTTWTAEESDAKFYFKYYDSDSNYPNDDGFTCTKANAKDTWVYPYVVPDNDYIGQVQVDRYVSSTWKNNTSKIQAQSRASSKPNCIKLNSSDNTTSWTTYCPPMSSATLSDNGTTKTAIGSGTEGSPYIVVTGTTIKVSAEAESAIDDDNMTAKYNFKVGGSSQQNSTTTTYTHEASTNNTVYAMSVSAYNNYNSTDGTAANSNVIYYKALDSYTISYSAGGEDGVTGSHDSDTKYYGIDLTLPGVVFSKTGYTQTGWATSKGGEKAYNLSITNYSGNADVTLYPTWTANPISVTLAKGTNGAANQSATINYDATTCASFTAVSGNTGYRCTGYYDGETQVLNADGSFAADNVTGYITSGKWTKASNCTLTAHWTEQNYSITYKDQGDETFSGTHADGHPTSHTYGSATALKKATKTGYAFAGWYTTSTCTGDAITSIGATAYSSNITLYARWVELDLHEPGVYEAPTSEGGYGRPLRLNSSHDYEVYYVKVDSLNGSPDKGCLYAGSKRTISDGYSMFKIGYQAGTEIKSEDGWVAFKAYKYGGSNGAYCNDDEFKTTTGGKMCYSNYARLSNAHYVQMYVQGYDEFAFEGRDCNTKGDNFVVKIDGVTATPSSPAAYTPSTDRHLTRYSISANEPHLIEVLGNSAANENKFQGFSLRLPDVTRYTVSATNTDGYGSVDVTSISNVRSGSTIYTSSNTLTVGGTTITATANSTTDYYSYSFNNWTKSDGTSLPGTVTGAITVRANFTQTPVNYTLAWNANGGDALNGTYTSGSTGYGTAITKPNDPTRDGYTFTGWNTEDDGTGDDYTGSMPAANTTYYAQWEVEVCSPINASITFDNNKSAKYNTPWASSDISTSGGASCTTSTSTAVETDSHPNSKMAMKLGDGNTAEFIKVSLPSGITSGSITIKVCTYSGKSGTIIINDEDNTSTPLISAEAGLEGETKTYMINDADGGSWSAPTLKTITYDEITSGGDFYIKRSAGASIYVFSVSATGTKVCPGGHDVNIDEDIENGSITASPESGASGDEVTLTVTPDTGYELDELTVTGETTSGTVSTTDNGDGTFTFEMPAEDVTVDATFTLKTYTVGFAVSPAGYGTVDESSIASVNHGSTVSISTNKLTLSGTTVTATAADQTDQYTYEFSNWSVSNGASITSAQTITANFTRTARTYTVTLNKDGGTINPGNNVTSYTYGVGATLPTDVTKSGYVFAGWYDNSSLTGDAVTTIASDATGNKEYWAKWTELEDICETMDDAFEASGPYGYKTINDVEYDIDAKDISTSNGVYLMTEAQHEAAEDKHDYDNYMYLSIGDRGIIKEIKITVKDIGDANDDAKGIQYTFYEEPVVEYVAPSEMTTSRYSIGATETFSIRPSSGDNVAFGFRPAGTWIKIESICIYYEVPCMKATITKNSSSYSLSSGETKDITSDATVTSGGAVKLVNDNASNKDFSFSAKGVAPETSDGYVEVVLPSGSILDEDAVIRITGEGTEDGAGLLLIDDDGNTIASQTNNGAIDFSYTVTSSSALRYLNHIRVKRAKTSSKNHFKSVTITGCMSCTALEDLDLSYSATTLYTNGGTPRQALPTLTGNDGGGTVTYSSSNTDVVTVNASTGVVTAVGAGTAKVTARIAASGDYCPTSLSVDFTVPALVNQSIRVGKSTSWNGDGSAAPDMTFNDPTSSTSQVAVIANNSYTFDATATSDKDNMTAKFTGTETTKGSKYVTLKFKNATHNLRLGEVIARIQPVNTNGKAQVEVYEGSTLRLTSSEVTGITQGQLNDVRFTFASPYVFAANTNIEVRLYFYGQTNGFRLGTPFYVNGGVLVDQRFTDANSTGIWSDPANWESGSLPEIYHDVVIEKPVAVDIAHATAKSIVIYNNGSDKTGKLTIQPNKGLEVDGTIQKTTDGSTKTATGEADLVLESSSAGNASLIFNNSNSCQATVQMYSKASIVGNTWNWQYVGTPFTGSIPLYNYYGSWMYKWNNGGWYVVKGSDELTPFVGYCLTQESATTHVMGGTLVPTTSKKVEMAANTDMVLANSWTAPIYVGGFTEETFTSSPATIYLFNTGSAENGSHKYDKEKDATEAGTYVTIPVKAAKYTGNEFIAPMQGFFVTTNGGATGTITMNYNDLVRPAGSHTDIVAGSMKAPKRIEERPEVMKIRAEGSVYNDRVVILSREDFSQGFDNGWDGKKMSFGNASPSVYVINEEGGYDAVSAIPEYEGTVVGFRAGTDSEYTIRFEYDGEEMLYLNDLQEQEATPIDSMRTYTFTAEAGDNEARFIISATPVQKVTTGVDPASGGQDAKVRKVIINDHIYIIRGGRMYSVDGALVK